MTERLAVEWAASADASAHVFVEVSLDDHLTIEDDDGHHLARVLRLQPGETVTAADGSGRWRSYRVEAVRDAVVSLRADGAASTEPELVPPLAVEFAVTKGQKPESVVDRLTQLGVDRIVAVTTERSVVRWKAAEHTPKLERLRRVAREAAMQCRRARLPDVEIADSLAGLAAHPGLVVADREGVAPEHLADPGPAGWLVVVGPEGGLSPGDVALLGSVPRLTVGPHVLRAESAAAAAAAVLTVRRRSADGPAAVTQGEQE